MPSPTSHPSYATFARTRDRFLLSVLTKKTYRWTAAGDVLPADEQLPMALDVTCAQRVDRNCEVPTQGRDVWPIKLATDVVVQGHVRAADEDAPASRLECEVRIGAHIRRAVAFGPRFVERTRDGSLSFSPPTPVSSVELSWWNAYGGIDPMVMPRGADDTPHLFGKPTLELFPGAYPRNPCGTGYLILDTPELLDGLTLPRLERPEQLLSPETFLVRDPAKWPGCPAPAGFGWCHSLWYPRMLHFGRQPYHPDETAPLVAASNDVVSTLDPKLCNEAAPDMILSDLTGHETISLAGFGTREPQRFRLPDEHAEIVVRIEGVAMAELERCLHSVVIDVDKRTFYLLRSTRFEVSDGVAEILSDRQGLQSSDELEDVLRDCEVRVDGHWLERDQWPNRPASEK